MNIRIFQSIPWSVFLLLSVFHLQAQEFVEVPPLQRRVSDLTATLSSREVKSLEERLESFEEKRGSQIAVLIIPSTKPETIEQYSIRVAEQWKLGREGVDDGVLLLVAKNDKKLRIEVGYGLEGAIPDVYVRRIVDNVIVPQFRNGHFGIGIHKGIDAILGLVEGEALEGVTHYDQNKAKWDKLGWMIPISIIFIVSIVSGFVKKKGYRIWTAVIASVLVGVFFSVFYGMISLVVSLFMLLGNSGGPGSRGGGRYYGGGHYGGRSSYGSGFGGGFSGGGFSGGGGGFGGGGASGGW